MKKIDLGQGIAIFANIAVLAGLVAVVVEIRTNTAAIRAASVQEAVTAGREYLMDIASNEDLSRIRQTGSLDLEDLTDAEAFRFQLHSRGNWLYFQNLWIQADLDILDERAWESSNRIICEFFTDQGWRQDWETHRPVLDSQFVAIVEDCPGLSER